jgi:SAM-dependent methyltransferase
MLTPEAYPLSGNLALQCCDKCGFISNLSGDSPKAYDAYYQKLNKHVARSSPQLELQDKQYFSSLLKYIQENSHLKILDASILDYGAGAHIFSDICLQFGAKEVLNFDVGMESFGGRHFDLVVATHTFEHLPNPLEDLRRLVDSVKDGGIVAISTPDASAYEDCYYGPYNHFDLEHINHFSPQSMNRLCQEVGLDVLAIRQGERLVAEGLAYSDLLIVATKRTPSKEQLIAVPSFHASEFLCDFLTKNGTDFEQTTRDIKDILSEAANFPRAFVAIYGLSSYAFRVMGFMKNAELLDKVDFFADSDPRLTGMHLFSDKKVLSRFEFESRIEENPRSRFFVIVASVNSHRILDMFASSEKMRNCIVRTVGPSTKNR